MSEERKAAFEIDLSRSRSPRSFRGSHNLWRDDLGRLYNLVEKHINSLKAHESRVSGGRSKIEDHPHLAIAIFGPSGSGKSSLLRTLADDVRNPGRGRVLPESLQDVVYSLDVMDPTTWSQTDQFLYAFLASALEQEQDREQMREDRRTYPTGLSPVQLAFQEVNEYLRVVDDLSSTEEYDPLGLSLQKLERHTSGLRLRKALGKFIDRLVEEFGVKAIFLPVDDLDMAPNHLVGSLESYQSFLIHPRLIPVFTFTDRMPEELIEAYYDDQLNAGGSGNPPQEGRLTISQQLAVQFLVRCFPVRNRIRLGSAPARVQRAVLNLGKRDDRSDPCEDGEQLEVHELLITASFLLFGHPDKEDDHQIRAALRPSTLRRQFQVVDAMKECNVDVFRSPQIVRMATPDVQAAVLASLAWGKDSKGVLADEKNEDDSSWAKWSQEGGAKSHRMMRLISFQDRVLESFDLPSNANDFLTHGYGGEFLHLTSRLAELRLGATWASIFNTASWSLLNVHRDTLRELGLYLEDLYSWTPKELRTVVLDRILSQDHPTRRAVVDRWFNRADYRRNQVLSLLAANMFRPWMPGEEPYGDDEVALRHQVDLERKSKDVKRLEAKEIEGATKAIDILWKQASEGSKKKQVQDRNSFRSTEGLLWFINVTLGFYLPQIMARDWTEAIDPHQNLKIRMSGNGWDLQHAPINAVRIADARQELFSFGTLFLDQRSYAHCLDSGRNEPEGRRGQLLLRLWSCCGYSYGRLWAAFSLWRGLSFLGRCVDLGLKHRSKLDDIAGNISGRSGLITTLNTKSEIEFSENGKHLSTGIGIDLVEEFEWLIRTHCLEGLVPGTLLDRGSDETRLEKVFPRWDGSEYKGEIRQLAVQLICWLLLRWDDRIVPMAAGRLWTGWGDDFIRRVHGEYILGGLTPRISAAYIEDHARYEDFIEISRGRFEESRVGSTREKDDYGADPWTAAVAAGAWSDVLLEYWRGCPQILLLLLTCPAFPRSKERFHELPQLIDENLRASKDVATSFSDVFATLKQSETVDKFKNDLESAVKGIRAELKINRRKLEDIERRI